MSFSGVVLPLPWCLRVFKQSWNERQVYEFQGGGETHALILAVIKPLAGLQPKERQPNSLFRRFEGEVSVRLKKCRRHQEACVRDDRFRDHLRNFHKENRHNAAGKTSRTGGRHGPRALCRAGVGAATSEC